MTALDVLAEPEIVSQPYVGRWNRLISTTNWEKGRIIHQWRQALVSAGAPSSDYADETWSRLVGGVSAQHVGRLRRVSQRFGDAHTRFEGLYWSHFLAAVDWEDSDRWLQSAAARGWSVALMRLERWQALGAPADQRPRDDDVVVAEVDEDAAAPRDAAAERRASEAGYEEIGGRPTPEGPDFGDEEPPFDVDVSSGGPAEATHTAAALVRPFANLPDLPDDLAEAFETFKLAILRHKSGGWTQVPRDDVVVALESLKQLCLAPTAP